MKHGKFFKFVLVIAVFGVMIGTMAVLISMSVLSGFENKLAETAVNFTSHIKVNLSGNGYINNTKELITGIKEKFPEVKSATAFLQKEALISTKYDVDGIVLKGISLENNSTGIIDKIIEDNIKSNSVSDTTNQVATRDGIIIGERLSKKINAKPGDSVVIYMMNTNSSLQLTPNNIFSSGFSDFPDVYKLPISGVYRTGMAHYDETAVYCDINVLSKLLKINNNISSGIDIMLKKTDEIKETSKEIEEYLKFPFYAMSVYDLHSSMFAWIEMQKEPIPLVLGLISLVAVMNIITILLILIVEKTHSIGILRILGMKSSNIMAIFLTKGTFIGVIGTVLGAIAAYLVCILQQNYQFIKLKGEIYFLDVLPINLEWQNYLIVITISIVIAFFVTLIPALIALKVTPIKAINFK